MTSYQPYITDVNMWKTHFHNMTKKNSPKYGFHVVKPSQSHGAGDPSVINVSPTEQDVARAKSEINRQRRKVIKRVNKQNRSQSTRKRQKGRKKKQKKKRN